MGILRQALSKTLGLPSHNVVIESVLLDGVEAGARRLRGISGPEDIVIKVDYVADSRFLLSRVDVMKRLSASEQILRQQIESEAAASGVPVNILAISTTVNLHASINTDAPTTTYMS